MPRSLRGSWPTQPRNHLRSVSSTTRAINSRVKGSPPYNPHVRHRSPCTQPWVSLILACIFSAGCVDSNIVGRLGPLDSEAEADTVTDAVTTTDITAITDADAIALTDAEGTKDAGPDSLSPGDVELSDTPSSLDTLDDT